MSMCAVCNGRMQEVPHRGDKAARRCPEVSTEEVRRGTHDECEPLRLAALQRMAARAPPEDTLTAIERWNNIAQGVE